MRALGAPRAHVLHARALSRHAALPPLSRPVSGPCSPAEPRQALALSPVPSKLSLAPCSAALAARRRRQRIPPRRRRPNRQRTPAAPEHRPCLSSRSSARFRRRHDALQLQKGGRRRSYPRPPREPASSAYLKGPRAQPITQATPGHPHSPPTASNRREIPFFPASGKFGCRRNPVHYIAARPSPVHPASPDASPWSCRAAQHLSLDQGPPEPKYHFTTVAPSAAELAAGDLLRPHLPSTHREDRLSLAVPSPPSDTFEGPPFVDGDRRSPAPVGQRRGGRGKNGQT